MTVKKIIIQSCILYKSKQRILLKTFVRSNRICEIKSYTYARNNFLVFKIVILF